MRKLIIAMFLFSICSYAFQMNAATRDYDCRKLTRLGLSSYTKVVIKKNNVIQYKSNSDSRVAKYNGNCKESKSEVSCEFSNKKITINKTKIFFNQGININGQYYGSYRYFKGTLFSGFLSKTSLNCPL